MLTVTAELSPIKAHIKDLKAYFADFVIEKCKREVVIEAVENIGAYIKYLEEKVNVNEREKRKIRCR